MQGTQGPEGAQSKVRLLPEGFSLKLIRTLRPNPCPFSESSLNPIQIRRKRLQIKAIE